MHARAQLAELVTQLDVNPETAERLDAYLALILKWNARINLTADREPEVLVRRHFAESLFAAQHVPAAARTLLDFGSGAGLPGIPIAIARPALAITLAESQGKKAAFLREAVRTLHLNAEVWDRRVEAMPADRVFDVVTLRAVDKMLEAGRAAVPRLAPGGMLLVFATAKTDAMLDTLPEIRWQVPVPIPNADEAFLKIGARA